MVKKDLSGNSQNIKIGPKNKAEMVEESASTTGAS